MTSHQATTVQFLTLNSDVLRLIGGYLDHKSKFRLTKVNVQTFSPSWPIPLCQFGQHIIDTSEFSRLKIFSQRSECICIEENRCTRCGMITCLDCADTAEIQSCELCDEKLCLRCQVKSRIEFSICLCGDMFCSRCGKDEFRGEPTCENCIDFQRENGFDDDDYDESNDEDEDHDFETNE
jgi:hypothetical protein